MPVKRPVGDIAQSYALLQEFLPGIEMDPRNWGPKGLNFLSAMAKAGPVFRHHATYLIEQDIKLYVTREAKGVGAGWHENVAGERWLSIDQSFGFVDTIIALGHESLHLQQPNRVRCSVEGEYAAWRLNYTLRAELSSAGGVIPMTEDEQRLASMPDDPTREDLKTAQALMQKMAGPNYLIGKAPLQGKDLPTAFLAFVLIIFNSFARRGEGL